MRLNEWVTILIKFNNIGRRSCLGKKIISSVLEY